MTLAMTPGERVRAAAISSRPTWAMNLTAGSAAAAGRGAAVRPARHTNANAHAEIAAARTPDCRFNLADRRVPMTVDMLCLTPLLAHSNAGAAPALRAQNTPRPL